MYHSRSTRKLAPSASAGPSKGPGPLAAGKASSTSKLPAIRAARRGRRTSTPAVRCDPPHAPRSRVGARLRCSVSLVFVQQEHDLHQYLVERHEISKDIVCGEHGEHIRMDSFFTESADEDDCRLCRREYDGSWLFILFLRHSVSFSSKLVRLRESSPLTIS